MINLLYSLPYDIQREIYSFEKKDKKGDMINEELGIIECLKLNGDFDYDGKIIPSHIKTLQKKHYTYAPHFEYMGRDSMGDDIYEYHHFDYK